MAFAVPADVRARWLEHPTQFYCPQGHPQHYTETEVQRLQKQLAEAQEKAQAATKRKEWAEQEAKNARAAEAAERAAKDAERASKVRAQKKLKRVANGVCPCCNRTFQNLARHMKTKHGSAT
jgi:type II secretory pathway component HofQ